MPRLWSGRMEFCVGTGDAERSAGDHPIMVQLLGGPAGGLLVQVPRLEDQISVYRNGGPPSSVGSGPGAFVGTYELVGPVGPETPIYVAT
jgi:hypothetical protein